MSQKIWVRGPICGVDNCRSRLYRSSDGMKICQYGHVMDGNIEINDDQDENYVTTKRLNIQVTGVGGDFGASPVISSQSTRIKTDKKLYGSQGRILYYKCLQILLKKQTNIIIETMLDSSIRSELEHIIKTNWTKLLSYHMNNGKDGSQDGLNKQGKYRLPMALDMISIIYLAAAKLKYFPIYVNEVIAKIKSNQIPYAKCLHLIPKKSLDKLQSYYFQLLQPYKLPLYNEFYESIQINGTIICESVVDNYLDLPLNYYYPLVFKILAENLILPNALELFNIFNTLFGKIGVKLAILFGTKESKELPKLTSFPDLKLLALLIFTVKVNFIYEISPVSYSSWLDNLSKYEMNNEYSFQTSRTIDLTNWSDVKIDKYCEWIYENLIPKQAKINSESGYPMSEGLSAMEKRLFQIFDFADTQIEKKLTKKRKLDPRQDLEPIGISISESITNMSEPLYGKVKLKDIGKIEDKLFSKLSENFGVTRALLMQCYDLIESEVKKCLSK